MQKIAAHIAQIKSRIEIVGADPITRHGFTQVPNFILTNKEISLGAKLTFAMLLKYAWADDSCFPGQERLSQDLGASKRSVVTFLAELQTKHHIDVERRGLGKTNIYKIFLNPSQAFKQRRNSPSNI